MKQKIGLFGGVIGFVTIVVFGVFLLIRNVPQNVASWIMWTVLDGMILASSFAAGNKRPWLPAGFTFGALFVTLILLTKGMWHWGTVETISAIGVGTAMICWWKLGPRSAVVATVLAMNIAGVPAMHDAWLTPNPASWWLWAGVALSCIPSCYGARAWTIEDRLLPCASFIFNGLMTILVLR